MRATHGIAPTEVNRIVPESKHRKCQSSVSTDHFALAKSIPVHGRIDRRQKSQRTHAFFRGSFTFTKSCKSHFALFIYAATRERRRLAG